jgi:NADH:ubiquinone oxidoreductase subunit F (NADH-binding)
MGPRSQGAKVFALAGKINKTVSRVTMEPDRGVCSTSAEVVQRQEGQAGRRADLQAMHPAQYLNTPVDTSPSPSWESWGGGFIVMDEDTCMVDLAKFFLEFVQVRVCGKCAPCRIGTKQMLDVLKRITRARDARATRL